MRRGLLPRSDLDQKARRGDLEYRAVDAQRLDGELDHNCVSISAHNYKMMFDYRKNMGIEFVHARPTTYGQPEPQAPT